MMGTMLRSDTFGQGDQSAVDCFYFLIGIWADSNIIAGQRQPIDELHRQGLAAYRALLAETDRFGGRILSVPLNPAVTGQPFRIKTLETLLAGIAAAGGHWSATGSQILAAWLAPEPPA